MVKRRQGAVIRGLARQSWLRWIIFGATGVFAGWMLGEMAVDGQLYLAPDASTSSFADFSANPEALAPQGETPAPCIDCPTSYGAVARMRAARAERMDDALRQLGEADPDLMRTPAEPVDDYRFGGGFPDDGGSERDPSPPERLPGPPSASRLDEPGYPARTIGPEP